jgi:hypothetical protein
MELSQYYLCRQSIKGSGPIKTLGGKKMDRHRSESFRDEESKHDLLRLDYSLELMQECRPDPSRKTHECRPDPSRIHKTMSAK